jgi:acetyl esterase/lipase
MTPSEHPAPQLDPEAGAVWQRIVASGGIGNLDAYTAGSLPTLRELAPTGADTLLRDRPYAERGIAVPGPAGTIPASVFTPLAPSPDPAPGILWLHGGGMIGGSRWGASEALDAAEAVRGVVVSIDYRLAPEHPAPAPLEDCVAVLRWVGEHTDELGIDPARLILGGGSAGGGLAAATALWVRDHGGPALAGLVLRSPMLDDRMTSVSSHQFGDDIVWSRARNAFGWGSLLGDRIGTDDVGIYDAPGRATDLSGLPPTFVDVGSADLFRDEDVAFASTVWACGGDAELHVWPGGYHGMESMAPDAALSVESRRARCRWVERRVGRPVDRVD